MSCLFCPTVETVARNNGRSSLDHIYIDDVGLAKKSLRFICKFLDLEEWAGLQSGAGFSVTFCRPCSSLFESVVEIYTKLSPLMKKINGKVVAKKGSTTTTTAVSPELMKEISQKTVPPDVSSICKQVESGGFVFTIKTEENVEDKAEDNDENVEDKAEDVDENGGEVEDWSELDLMDEVKSEQADAEEEDHLDPLLEEEDDVKLEDLDNDHTYSQMLGEIGADLLCSPSASNKRKAPPQSPNEQQKRQKLGVFIAPDDDNITDDQSGLSNDPEEFRFKCQVCDSKFSYRSGLTRHMPKCDKVGKEELWPRRYSCTFCTRIKSNDPKRWWKHILRAHLSKLMHCESCNQHFYNQTNFEAHNAVIHSADDNADGPFHCGLCEETTILENKSLFFDHLLYHHTATGTEKGGVVLAKATGISEYTCATCGRCFKNRRQLKEHTLVHIDPEERKLTCEFCPKSFIRKEALTTHVSEVHETNPELEKKYKCKHEICKKQFVSTLTLQCHERLHKVYKNLPDKLLQIKTEEEEPHSTKKKKVKKIWNCKEEGCNFGSTNRSLAYLRGHEQKEHPYLLIHECTLCDKKYAAENFLETHIVTHNADLEGPFECKVCFRGTLFLTREALALHLARHNGEATHPCEQCPNLSFHKLTDLNLHMLKNHDADSKFKCDDGECRGKKFIGSKQLESHQRKFHPAKDAPKFPCDICPRIFNTQGQRTSHISGCHTTKDLSVFCEICGFKAKDAGLYRLHKLRVHNRDELEKAKKHVCYFCSNTFYTFFELNLHLAIHTLERPYICHVCHKDFTQNHCLSNHLKMHKKDGTFFPKPIDPPSDSDN